MFDKYYSEKTNYVPYDKTVAIHEYKAPTDDSARLLKELEEKAIDKIFANFTLDNPLNAAVIYTGRDMFANELKYEARFELNSKQYRVLGSIPQIELEKSIRAGNNNVFLHIVENVSNAIAVELVKQAAPELDGVMR